MNASLDHMPESLRPYFEVGFPFGFGLCEGCGREEPFTSQHPQFADEWWLEKAKPMKEAGWVAHKNRWRTSHNARSRKAFNERHIPASSSAALPNLALHADSSVLASRSGDAKRGAGERSR